MSKEYEQNIMLIKCKHCGQIYKVVDTKYNAETLSINFVTDFQDLLPVDINTNCIECVKCKNKSLLQLGDNMIFAEDWVVDKVFTIKG